MGTDAGDGDTIHYSLLTSHFHGPGGDQSGGLMGLVAERLDALLRLCDAAGVDADEREG